MVMRLVPPALETVGGSVARVNDYWKNLDTPQKAWLTFTLACVLLLAPMCARRVRPNDLSPAGLNTYRSLSVGSIAAGTLLFLLSGSIFNKAKQEEQERNILLSRTLGAQDALALSTINYAAIAQDHKLQEELLPPHMKPSTLQAQAEALYREQMARQEKRADRLERLAVEEVKALKSAAVKEEKELKIPEEDMAQSLAQYQGGWVLIVAPTGCGKTNFLNAAISKANAYYKGEVDFSVTAGKENEKGYLGLEKSTSDYYLCDTPSAVQGFISFHQGVMAQLYRADVTVPVVYVADEWNNILLSAQVYDMQSSKPRERSEKEKELALSVIGGVTRGRTKRHFGWLTTHSPDVQAIGLPDKIKHSCTFIVMGRSSLNGMLYEAVKGKQTVIQDDRLRKKLLAQLDAFYDEDSSTDKERVVALTNLGGQWRLVMMPVYQDHLPNIERSPYNQSTEELLQDDSAPSSPPAAAVQPPAPPAPPEAPIHPGDVQLPDRYPAEPEQPAAEKPETPPAPPEEEKLAFHPLTQDFLNWVAENSHLLFNRDGWMETEILFEQSQLIEQRNEFMLLLVSINRAGYGEFKDLSHFYWKPTFINPEIEPEEQPEPTKEEQLLAALDSLQNWSIDFFKRTNQVIKARDVQRSQLPLFKGRSADLIRKFFLALSQQGRGELSGEGERTGYMPYMPDQPE
jgi:hypothetical protein